MPKNITGAASAPAAFILAVSFGFWLACSSEEKDGAATLREIRGHTRDYGGVPHGDPAFSAGRYCTLCHGATLAGGNDGEPSCYGCHGQNWLVAPGAAAVAPSDHSINNSGYMHKTGHSDPLGTGACATCHGEALAGTIENGLTQPGCLLCHEQKW